MTIESVAFLGKQIRKTAQVGDSPGCRIALSKITFLQLLVAILIKLHLQQNQRVKAGTERLFVMTFHYSIISSYRGGATWDPLKEEDTMSLFQNFQKSQKLKLIIFHIICV